MVYIPLFIRKLGENIRKYYGRFTSELLSFNPLFVVSITIYHFQPPLYFKIFWIILEIYIGLFMYIKKYARN